MSAAAAPSGRTLRVARVVTEVLAPVVLVLVVLVVVSLVSADDAARGVLLGLVASFFVGGLPYAVLLLGVRGGRLGDRHLSRREERPLMMLLGLVSVGGGVAALRALAAPAMLLAVVWAMLAGVAVGLCVTVVWKISIHTASASGAVTSLALAVHPALWVLAPLVVLIGWSRVRLGAHSTAEVLAGAVVGVVVSGGVLLALS